MRWVYPVCFKNRVFKETGQKIITNIFFQINARQVTCVRSTTTGGDFYLMVLEDDASSLDWASYYGGDLSTEHVDGGTSRFDRKGRIYQSVCAGCGGNDDFPIKPDPGAVSAVNNNSCNNVTKLSEAA